MGKNLGDVMEQIHTFLESSEGREETVIISFKQVSLHLRSFFLLFRVFGLSRKICEELTGEYFKPFIRINFDQLTQRKEREMVL